MNAEQKAEALRLANALQAGADDPMWADHAEFSKRRLSQAAALLRTLAAEPQGEPVAWIDPSCLDEELAFSWERGLERNVPVYTHPAQTPLTDHDLKPIVQRAMQYYGYDPSKFGFTASAGFVELSRDIEAAHGITPPQSPRSEP